MIDKDKSKEELIRELQELQMNYNSLNELYQNNITIHKQGEDALRENEQKFRQTIVNLDEGYYSVTLDGVLLDHNQAFCHILGFDRMVDLRGSQLPDFWQNPDERHKYLQALKVNDSISKYQINAKKQNKEKITVIASAHLVLDKNKLPLRIEGIFLDITERMQTEEKLKNTLENLECSNKELEQFAYVASHDLQEPLRMVSSFTQLLERRYKDKLDQDANDFIQYAVDGANRMQKLINDLLDYSRITSRGKDFTKVDISHLLGQTISNLQQLIIENTALITNEDLPEVKADESQLIRVFQNLIENAIKFKKKTEMPKIHVSCNKKEDFYEFAVKDNGIGINMQFHDRIFTIFQRLHSKDEYPGTGIGLSICKRIVERHGGKIWFESKENEGTTFYFTLKI